MPCRRRRLRLAVYRPQFFQVLHQSRAISARLVALLFSFTLLRRNLRHASLHFQLQIREMSLFRRCFVKPEANATSAPVSVILYYMIIANVFCPSYRY